MEPLRILALALGIAFLTFGLVAFRYFYPLVGATAGLVLAVAARRPLLELPGLSGHRGVASVLIILLLVLLGVFLAARLRRIIAFLAGTATGALLFAAGAAIWAGRDVTASVITPAAYGLLELMAGLVFGILFLLVEPLVAVALSSAAGAALGAWALGGRWTFGFLMVAGLVVQPWIAARFHAREGGKGKGKRKPGAAASAILLSLILPAGTAHADWAVERVSAASGMVVLAAGRRQGVNAGEEYAVLDRSRKLLEVVKVAEVFSDSSYAQPRSPQTLSAIQPGFPVLLLEEYEFETIRSLGGESRMEKFLARYPESRHAPEVKEKLEESRFRRAMTLGTMEAYREFREGNPDSPRYDEVLRREEALAFASAKEKGTEEAFRVFIRTYPGTRLISGLDEFRHYERARQEARIFAYQDFTARYPKSSLGQEFKEALAEFSRWSDELEFGKDRLTAVRRLAGMQDDAVIPLLVGKLLDPEIGREARSALRSMGTRIHAALMEVLISPLQSLELKDEVATILGEHGDLSVIPALRTFVKDNDTPAGKKALRTLEERVAK